MITMKIVSWALTKYVYTRHYCLCLNIIITFCLEHSWIFSRLLQTSNTVLGQGVIIEMPGFIQPVVCSQLNISALEFGTRYWWTMKNRTSNCLKRVQKVWRCICTSRIFCPAIKCVNAFVNFLLIHYYFRTVARLFCLHFIRAYISRNLIPFVCPMSFC